jgi:hypothetical protein
MNQQTGSLSWSMAALLQILKDRSANRLFALVNPSPGCTGKHSNVNRSFTLVNTSDQQTGSFPWSMAELLQILKDR